MFYNERKEVDLPQLFIPFKWYFNIKNTSLMKIEGGDLNFKKNCLKSIKKISHEFA